MKSGWRWLWAPVAALALASCAATYDTGYGYYGNYADYAYPDDYYGPGYGGVVFGGGWHDDRSRHGDNHDVHHFGADHGHAGGHAVRAGAMHAGGHGGGRHG